MRIAHEKLASRLRGNDPDNLPKLILINGNEPLLVEETLDQVREALKAYGFDERIKYQLDASFDWNLLTGVGQAMSLFSSRRLLELRVPKSLGTAGCKAVIQFCNNPPEADMLLILMSALDKQQRQAKWLKVVENCGWLVDIYPVGAQQFPAWIKQRLQSRALRVEPGVVDLLVNQLEGNVLAAAQEIDKLQVLAEHGAVTLKLLSSSLADQARFDVYTLTDVCLSGDFARAMRIKRRLQSEGIEPVIVVWSLVKEIRVLASLSSQIAAGQNRSMLYKQNRIWSKREAVVTKALQRINTEQWFQIHQQAAHLDQTVKGQRFQEAGSVWYQIELLCAAICGLQVVGLSASG